MQSIDDDAVVIRTDLDGLNVYRTLRFSAGTAEWLNPVVRLMEDKRIIGYGIDEATGELLVTFSHRSIVGDSIVPFNVADFKTIHDAKVKQALDKPARRRTAKKVAQPEGVVVGSDGTNEEAQSSVS